MPTQSFNVLHTVSQGVVLKTGMRAGASRAPLVKQHNAPDLGVKETSVPGLATGTRPAMKKNGRHAFRVATFLNINRWLIFGGSWGSTLGLAYAETHPSRCLALVLRGIFLCRKKDIQWFYQDGADKIFPDGWADFERIIPPAERHDMVAAYYRRLSGEDETARLQAAQAWSRWEGRTLCLRPSPQTLDFFSCPDMALSLARIECHYFVHNSFMENGQLLQQASRLADIPGTIVHGRYDVVCPLEQAWELKAHWPQARLEIVEAAGHAANEPGIVDRLIAATDELAEQL